MNPELITEPSISAKLKGLLMLIKSHCIKGTNYLWFNSKQHLSEILHIGKNTLPTYLKELESKGFIRYIGNSLHLSNEYFYLFTSNDISNLIYQAIYDYCLILDVVPPYKDTDTNDIGLIATEFPEPDLLLSILKERCPKLPLKPSMNYFTKTLRNKRAVTQEPTQHEYYID